MSEIIVRRPGTKPVRHELSAQGFTIGQGPENALALPGDPRIASFHAEIRLEDGHWLLARRTVRNGLQLNGHALTVPQFLLSGDRIVLGDAVIVFESSEDEPPSSREPADPRGDRAELSRWLPTGGSSAILSFVALLRRLAASDSTLLLVGETGSGKELAAHAIHHFSARRHGPFAVVNCPALPSSLVESELFGIERGVATGVQARVGLLESAASGTIFFDEIGDLEPAAQTKLLRFIQERTIEHVGGRREVRLDVRIIAATHHDLEASVAAGRFRLDLYHRLKVLTLCVPCLRDRIEDIPLLMERFLQRSATPALRVSAEALRILQAYDFPGNVRELEHLARSFEVFVEGGVILPEHIPDNVRSRVCGTKHSVYRQVVEEKGSFWELVQQPFLRRQLSREEVRSFVERAYDEADGSYKKMASLMHIAPDHKRLMDFLHRHQLGVGVQQLDLEITRGARRREIRKPPSE